MRLEQWHLLMDKNTMEQQRQSPLPLTSERMINSILSFEHTGRYHIYIGWVFWCGISIIVSDSLQFKLHFTHSALAHNINCLNFSSWNVYSLTSKTQNRQFLAMLKTTVICLSDSSFSWICLFMRLRPCLPYCAKYSSICIILHSKKHLSEL